MTIGLVVSSFDFRSDVRRVIKELLAQEHKVVIYYETAHQAVVQAHQIPGCEYRAIEERVRTAANIATKLRYMLRRKLPKSEGNFYLMERFKTSLLKTTAARVQRKTILFLMKFTKQDYSYDAYLRDLSYSGRTPIAEVDHFLWFTEIANDELLARLIAENRSLFTYVYSWDHPCKHTRFTQHSSYGVWNNGIANDLVELQGVPRSKIRTTGSSQFAYIHEYINRKSDEQFSRTYPFEYLYIGCAVGLPLIARQELELVARVARVAYELFPELKVVIRPYPLLRDWTLYTELKALPNVVFDDQYGANRQGLSVATDSIFEKIEKLDNALAFFHLGTTMGLECCLLDTPSFIIDLPTDLTADGPSEGDLSIYHFIHQYQNQKYLIDAAPANHVTSEDVLKGILNDLMEGRVDPYLKLNEEVRTQTPLKSFREFSQQLVSE